MLTLLNKRTLLNLGLVSLALVLALVAWLEPGKKAAPEAENLTDLAASRVYKIRIERREGKTVEIDRVDGMWLMREPVKAVANSFRIESLLRVTEYKSLGHNPVDGLDLAKYALDKPAVRLFLNDDIEMEFGESTPLDNRRYVRLGDTVHLIKDAAYYHLIGKWTTFLSQRLIDEGLQIDTLELPGLILRKHEGNWLPEPKPENFSADASTRLIQNWQSTQAIEVRPYAVKDVDEANAESIRIRLSERDEPLHFYIVARQPDLILVRPDLGVAYHLPQSRGEDLLALHTEPAPVGIDLQSKP